MPEKIHDYATGKERTKTREEVVRQQFERILIDDLGYPKSHVDIEFPIRRGSKGRAESADIAVFNSPSHDQTNLRLIVETKAPGESFDNQVFSYATATTAEYAVWFDGLDRDRSQGAKYFWRDLENEPTNFVDIPAIPGYGQSLEEIGNYKKSQLKPAKNLKLIFRKMHNRLYGEGPLKREGEIAREVIKLLFCKLYDELYTSGETCRFRATVKEVDSDSGRKAVGNRIRDLFGELQSDPEYSSMFENEEIRYGDEWITHIVSELQAFSLTHPETDTDAVGEAYEVFLGPQLKGESGQFFTPRTVVRMAVEMLDPSMVDRERLIDPACGSGGFLTYCLRHVRDEAHNHYNQRNDWVEQRVREYATSFICGLEIEPLLHRVAKSYMAILGDGRNGLFQEDSLSIRSSWSDNTKEKIELDSFDVVLTNPPFGTKIKIESDQTLEEYDLGHDLKDGQPQEKRSSGQDPAILFIERVRDFLKQEADSGEAGRAAIVLPRQILSGHDGKIVEIRKWILRNFKVDAVVDLPSETFQPYTGTITSVLFVTRKPEGPPSENDYDVYMAISENIGHDRRGNQLVRRDQDGNTVYDEDGNPILLNELPNISDGYARYKNEEDLEDPNWSPEVPCFTTDLSEILDQDESRLDASYYDPETNEIAKKIQDLETESSSIKIERLAELVDNDDSVFYPGRHKRNYVDPKEYDAVPFLSGTQILQTRAFDVNFQPRSYEPMEDHFVEEGWILITRSGSTGRVIYVGEELAGYRISDGVAVTEHAIRVIPDKDKIHPGYLYAFLSSDIGEVLINKGIYASVVEHITPEHILDIPVPVPPSSVQEEIGENALEAIAKKNEANSKIQDAQADITSIIE